MSKLLNKPFKAFTIYALVILLCSIPVYYYVVDSIWLHELDEHNRIIKERIRNSLSFEVEETELKPLVQSWNILQPGTSLVAVETSANLSDSNYTVNRRSEIENETDSERFRGLASYLKINGKYYRLFIETNVEEADETMLAISLVTLLFFILLAVGFVILNNQISKKIWQPFRDTIAKMKSFDLSRQQVPEFEETDIDEFRELNETLQKLIDKNIATYNQQKAFTENAAHELQTPLAVLKSKMDLLLQQKNLNQEQSELISATEFPLARLSRINKNLLLLAKIENNQYQDKEQLELTKSILETVELLSDFIFSKQISVEKDLSGELLVHCNKTLLEILLNNLLINAIVHNVESGQIWIKFTEKKLVVSNTGLSKLDPDKLFERFGLSSAGGGSSGLGLAIIKETCSLNRWDIRYSFQDGVHSFSIDF